MRFYSLFAGILSVTTCVAVAQDNTLSADAVRECSRKNFPTQTAVQDFNLTTVAATGVRSEMKGKLSWRLSEEGFTQTNLCFYAPPKLNGTCYLVLERADADDIFVYLPAVKKVKRVTGGSTSQSLLGTDISYEDLRHLQGLAAGGNLVRQPDQKINDLPVYVLENTPAAALESPYARVVSFVDQATCIPLQVDFYEASDNHRKRLTIQRDTLVEANGHWQIRDLALKDLRDESVTELQFTEVTYDDEIASRVFRQRSFYLAP